MRKAFEFIHIEADRQHSKENGNGRNGTGQLFTEKIEEERAGKGAKAATGSK